MTREVITSLRTKVVGDQLCVRPIDLLVSKGCVGFEKLAQVAPPPRDRLFTIRRESWDLATINCVSFQVVLSLICWTGVRSLALFSRVRLGQAATIDSK